MKTFEILTRVKVHDEARLMQCAQEQYDRDGGDGLFLVPQSALEELSHIGDPFHPDGPRPALACGMEILGHDVREITPPAVPPCFPPEVAQAHAAELRHVVADLLEWNAHCGQSNNRWWRDAKALMEQIRDEEDAARELGQ